MDKKEIKKRIEFLEQHYKDKPLILMIVAIIEFILFNEREWWEDW